jgi:outer membrane protein OmpA-like peptidoglycan-associated protein
MWRLTGFMSCTAALCCCCALGCSSPNGKLTQIQQDKEQLLVAIREQRDKNRQLQNQVVSLESRLDEAEKELARGGSGTRMSARPKQPPSASSKSLPPARNESLPWRPPAGKTGESAPPAGRGKLSGPALNPASGALRALAEREGRVHLDTRAGVARIDASLAFDEKTQSLTAESKRELDQVSKLLRTEEGRNLQITVSAAGDPDRAQAVADYLDRHGVPQERLTVASSEMGAPNAARGNPRGGVEILLSEADRPVRR